MEALVSLNGRKPQLMIDPEIDLAQSTTNPGSRGLDPSPHRAATEVASGSRPVGGANSRQPKHVFIRFVTAQFPLSDRGEVRPRETRTFLRNGTQDGLMLRVMSK